MQLDYALAMGLLEAAVAPAPALGAGAKAEAGVAVVVLEDELQVPMGRVEVKQPQVVAMGLRSRAP